MKKSSYKLVVRNRSGAITCGLCGQTSWEWRDVRNRFCPNSNISLETSLQRAWREFKEKPEYQTSAFPFPPRRMSVGDKLWSMFHGALMLVGGLWLLGMLLLYLLQ